MTGLREELSARRSAGPAAIAFGVFDGVHLGHRHVLRKLADDARDRGLAPVVVTPANHPLSVLRPNAELRLLTSLRERLELLRQAGPAEIVPITFTRDVSLLSARDFMRALKDCLQIEHFVAGADFALGHNREGTMPVLAALGKEIGYTIEAAGHFLLDSMPVSSTAVRKALQSGDIALARRLLGRPFALDGPVIEGEGRGGGLLGYPTANIGVGPLQALPADGVYAARLRVGDRSLPAAASIGSKPTFHDGGPTVVEAFVIDFDGNLYDEHVKLEFVQRLRGQEKFESPEALVARIEDDVAETRRILAEAQPAQDG